VRKIHAANVHRRVIRIHRSERVPDSNAPMAKANGTVKPTKPRYRKGG
jgi:hypothetical protein